MMLVSIFVSLATLTMLIIWLLPLIWLVKIVVSVVVVFQSIYVSRQYAWLTLLSSVNAVSVNHQQQLNIYQNNGEVHDVDVCAQTFVSVYLTVLCVKKLDNQWLGRYLTVIITPFNTEQNNARQLRAWLKWRKTD